MKKKITLAILLALIIIICPGWMNEEINLNIESNKKMNIYFKLTSNNGELSSDKIDYLNNKFQPKGIIISKLSDGILFRKTVDNIDGISDKDNTSNNVMLIFADNYQKQYYFNVTHGFFKNIYNASFSSNEIIHEISESFLNDIDTNGSDLKMIITLPSSSIRNNADIVSQDGKTLTWNVSKDKTIEFEYSLINRGSTYTTIIGAFFLLLLIIITIISSIKPKKKEFIFDNPESLKPHDLGKQDHTTSNDSDNTVDSMLKEHLSI